MQLRLAALLTETDHLQLHTDLYDTHIDSCTPELLLLVQDNFDWQDLRRDLLPGVLGQFEMLGKTMYTHVLSSEYAARVHDPYTYGGVTRDIVQLINGEISEEDFIDGENVSDWISARSVDLNSPKSYSPEEVERLTSKVRLLRSRI